MTIDLKKTIAFEQFKPLADRIEARMISTVREKFDRWAKLSGGCFKYYRSSHASEEAQLYSAVASFVESADGYSLRGGAPVALNEDRLQRKARQFGEDSVMSFVAKLISKVGDIEMSLEFLAGADFVIRASVNGHDVRIEQQTVYKYTQRNTLYCQFPARIYVDGKFTPASKFEEASA